MSERITWRKNLALFFRKPENLTVFITIIVTGILGIRSISSGRQEEYFQAVLAILALLAFGQLFSGYSAVIRDTKTTQLISAFDSIAQGRFPAGMFLTTRSHLTPIEARLPTVTSTLDLLGLSLLSICSTHQGTLRSVLESGVRVRLVITNPANAALQETIATRILEVESGNQHAGLVQASLDSLHSMIPTLHRRDNLEIRIIDTIPPFSYVGIDTDLPKGQISVEFYLSKVPLNRNPILLLENAQDAQWFDEFRCQFNSIWETCSPLDPAA